MQKTTALLTGFLTIKRPVLFAVLVAAVSTLLTQLLAYQSYLLRHNAEKEEMARELNAVRDRFQVVLTHNLSAAHTLAFIIRKYGVPDDFGSVARAIVDANSGVDALQLTDKGTITHVYPLEGNRSVIGYDILANPDTRLEALIAIQKKELFFAGPLSLKQGGMGIVGRLPIFLDGRFSGFAAVITRLDNLVASLGIQERDDSRYIYQLSKTNPTTGREDFFLANSIQRQPGQVLTTTIPDGNWKLYILRRHGLGSFGLQHFSWLGILFSLLCGAFAWYVAREPKKLEALVRNKAEQIRAAENTNKTTLERVRDAVIALDTDWRYTYLNDTALLQHPAGRQATLGRALWEVHPDVVNSAFWEKLQEAMQHKRVLEMEEYYTPLKAWFTVKIYPSENGLTLFYRDITAQKASEREAREQKLLSESIINSLPGIFYLYDRNLKFIKWNRNFESVSGYSAEEIRNMSPLDFFDADEQSLLQNRIELVFEKGIAEVEAHFLTKDKRKIPYYFNGHLSTIHGVDYLIGVGIDITERRAAEQEKERVTNDLVQRYKNMEQFSYIVSHNIRAPVANLIGLTNLLKRVTLSAADRRRALEGLSTAAHRLDEVIHDLNQILSIRTNVMAEKEPIRFDELVALVLQSIENDIRGQDIYIRSDFSALQQFNTVPVYLHSIFFNLICNSIKYRQPGRRLEIRISSEQQPGCVLLRFRDNGLGIDLARHGDNLFGLYKRFHLHIEGKGLGLFMVRTQVESLGGKIEVHSVPGQFTEFVIEFPLTE